MSDDPQTKAELLDRARTSRAAFEQLFTDLTPEQLSVSGVEADWSIKDIIHHVAAWEKLMTQWLIDAKQGSVPDRPAMDGIDALNAEIEALGKAKDPDNILREFHAGWPPAEQAILAMNEDELFRTDFYAWRSGSPLWHMVAGNTFWHYAEHTESITAWRKGQS